MRQRGWGGTDALRQKGDLVWKTSTSSQLRGELGSYLPNVLHKIPQLGPCVSEIGSAQDSRSVEKSQVSRVGRVLGDFLPSGNSLLLARAALGASCPHFSAALRWHQRGCSTARGTSLRAPQGRSRVPDAAEATEWAQEAASARTDLGLLLH